MAKRKNWKNGNRVSAINTDADEVMHLVDSSDEQRGDEDDKMDSDEEIEHLTAQINAIRQRQNDKNSSNPRQKRPIPKKQVNLALHQDAHWSGPSMNIVSVGKVWLDSGAEVSGINEWHIPEKATIQEYDESQLCLYSDINGSTVHVKKFVEILMGNFYTAGTSGDHNLEPFYSL